MKKKIFVVALAACLLILSVAGSSMAYFTDTAEYTNVFTAGNVKIALTESVATKNATTGDIEIAQNAARGDYNADKVYNPLFPSQMIAKDPRIENIGTESAYVGAIITIGIKDGYTTPVTTPVDNGTGYLGDVLSATDNVTGKTYVGDFITGLNTAEATMTITEVKSGENVIGFTIYLVFTEALDGKVDATIDYANIFTGMQIPETWDNTEMAYVNGLQINVKAYATQTAGMTDGALKALQAAFDAFDSLN